MNQTVDTEAFDRARQQLGPEFNELPFHKQIEVCMMPGKIESVDVHVKVEATTATGFTASQLEARRALITGTDAAAICGVSPWATAHDVWLDKMGMAAPREQSWRMRRGSFLEALGLDWMSERLAEEGIRLVRTGTDTRTHKQIAWLGATPDAETYVGDKRLGVGEVKTASPRASAAWTDEDGEHVVPDHYLIQVAVQMSVDDVEDARVCALLDADDEPRLYQLARDRDLEESIIESVSKFRRDHIDTRIPPPIDDSDGAARLVKRMYQREKNENMIAASADTEELARKWFAAAKAEKEAKASKDALQTRLSAAIGDCSGITGDGWRARWTAVKEQVVEAHTRKSYRKFDLRAKG
jgi:putative phage-type endonuclease